MPPRGVYKAKQEEKKKQNRSPRPAQEARSDRREQERQEKANAQRALRESIARQKAKSNTKLTSPSPRRDPADIQGKIQTVVSKASGPKTTRKVVEANQPVKMSPPIPKPKSPTKFTLKGGQIKSGTIYKDPITGSTLASKETRIKAITDPKSVKVVGSRNRQTLLQARPDMSQTQLFNTQQKITSNNVDVVNRLDNPQQTKLDLVTGEKITPTLLTELSRKRKRRQKSGFTGIMSQIRSLLG
jgi:hypothetical protein